MDMDQSYLASSESRMMHFYHLLHSGYPYFIDNNQLQFYTEAWQPSPEDMITASQPALNLDNVGEPDEVFM